MDKANIQGPQASLLKVPVSFVLLGTSTSSPTRQPSVIARPVLLELPVLQTAPLVLPADQATTPTSQQLLLAMHPVLDMPLFPIRNSGAQHAVIQTLPASLPLPTSSLWAPPTKPFAGKAHTAWEHNPPVQTVGWANIQQPLEPTLLLRAKTARQAHMQSTRRLLAALLVVQGTMASPLANPALVQLVQAVSRVPTMMFP